MANFGRRHSARKQQKKQTKSWGEKEATMDKPAIPPDFFETLYHPTNEVQPPRVPDGSKISKALATELDVTADKPSIASD